ncbi:ABC transporter ATP-binding protein [Sporichthya polymorpha]|uniref:ABC transporter ATP-binding protein n=1 Tax=Sporichthya polymorpha TaxID=35751 RepID=UPI0012EBF931|nr:ABC transporter ATP-binding protein [Sporichthya polymorpha]
MSEGMHVISAPTFPLTLESVVKDFGKTRAVDGISLTVGPGEIVAMVGPSGCGKSTTLRMIAGLERPDAGRVTLAGRCVAGPDVWVPAERRGVGLVFQDHALFPHLTVENNVGFGLPRRSPDRAARIREVLDLVSLGPLAGRYPHELSGGEQQRVALARALAPKPPIVLLDEAFSSLDRGLRAQIRTDTVAILRHTGTAAILITHDRDEALATGDRVVILRAGRVEQDASPDEAFHHPATRFVANFVGDAVFLPAERDAGMLHCEITELIAPRGLGHGEVEIVARPHEVTLDAGGPGKGEVTALEFQGAFILYTVALKSGVTIRSLQPHELRLEVGARVSVGLAPGISPSLLVDGVRPAPAEI